MRGLIWRYRKSIDAWLFSFKHIDAWFYRSAVVLNWHFRKPKRLRSSLCRSNWFLRKTRRFSSVTSSAAALPLASVKFYGSGGVKIWEDMEGLQRVRPRCKQHFFWRLPFKNLMKRPVIFSSRSSPRFNLNVKTSRSAPKRAQRGRKSIHDRNHFSLWIPHEKGARARAWKISISNIFVLWVSYGFLIKSARAARKLFQVIPYRVSSES